MVSYSRSYKIGGVIIYIEWDINKINNYLKDKIKKRGVDATEYYFLTKHLRKINPKIIIDVGTFLGISGYILGTSSKNIKYVYGIENIDDESFVPYNYEGKDIPKSYYGKFLPKDGILKTHGYHNDLEPLLKKHHKDLIFVFLDAKKQTLGVLEELEICYKNKVKYVGIHDTSMWYRNIRRAMKRAIKLGWYELIDEINIEDIGEKRKGASILRLIE